MDLIKEVQENVFSKCFAKGNFKEGREMLRKLAFKIDENSTTEEKRIVLYNLAWVNKIINESPSDIAAAKFHIKNVKSIVEQDKFYCKKEVRNYNMILQLFSDLYKDNLPTEERLKNERKVLENYYIVGDKLGYYTAKFNIAMIKDSYREVEWCIRDLHTYYLSTKESKEEKTRYDSTIKDMISEIKLKHEEWTEDICLSLSNNLARLTSNADIVVGEVF